MILQSINLKAPSITQEVSQKFAQRVIEACHKNQEA